MNLTQKRKLPRKYIRPIRLTNNLQALRVYKGIHGPKGFEIRPKELYTALGWTYDKYRRIEKYHYLPDKEIRDKICAYLGVTEGEVWPDIFKYYREEKEKEDAIQRNKSSEN